MTLPTESSGIIRDADSNLLDYLPIGTCALTTYNQRRTNQFDVALDTTNGTLYAINVSTALYGQPCMVLCVKNEIF